MGIRFLVAALLLVLAACASNQSTTPVIEPELGQSKTLVSTREQCRTSTAPKCKFVVQQAALNEEMEKWLFSACAEASTSAEADNCILEYYKAGFQLTPSTPAACTDRDLAFQLICLTVGGEAYDLAARAGMREALAFDWSEWSASSALTVLRQQSADACIEMKRQDESGCASEVFADRLGLPSEDFVHCSAAGNQAAIEDCLLQSHGYHFRESALRRMQASHGAAT